MNNSPAIRLLASANNERGDLFTRLTMDLFFALGYDNLRLDVHKSGRELDLQGEHRLEPRLVIGECKAHAAKMGGAELNKFFGALTRERKKCAPTPIAGYFVSLGGFTETGIVQESATGDDRIILLDSQKIVDELERCRVIVRHADAAERAGQCAQHAGLREAALDGSELLGHQRGYLWAIFYAHGKERTHFALIHADGTPLAENVALEVIEADRLCDGILLGGGILHTLRYLAPPLPTPNNISLASKATASYRRWIGEECGYIHLDGLPADTDLSATRLKLERLFVPLKATFLPKPDDAPEVKQKLNREVFSIGNILERAPHLAILAGPGGGKSTILKRLATAYAFPERRDDISDDLPQRDWLPLLLRCRELRDRAHRPITELLDDITLHAGMDTDECASFRESVHAALRSGQILLLVDGLDEISDEGARQTFVNHLRTFIAIFPQIALVVTSREAGFRLVAGVVASTCVSAKLATLDEDDVLSLCERWHVEVVGDSDKVRTEARELGQAIWDNTRIRRLSENPLLLTTLLVVKRWIGELPRSRAALYREAIRVLVRTWNVEGYAPLDEDETLAQLSYVACSMMEKGEQQIGEKALLILLHNARKELEAELQFARISPQEFIERIEYRSSLLMQTGHERTDDVLEPIYEFRHLTFQEYLAARGYVEEQYPSRDSGLELADVLEVHFEDEHWQEVIPLAAVLAGRKAESLMKRLTAASARTDSPELRTLLYQCIRDEVQVTAPTLRTVLEQLARVSDDDDGYEFEEAEVDVIHRGKFGAIFQEVAEQAYLEGGDGFEEYIQTVGRLAVRLSFGDTQPTMDDIVVSSLLTDLETGDRLRKIRAALVCLELAYLSDDIFRADIEQDFPEKAVLQPYFQSLSSGLSRMLNPADLPCAIASSWAWAWIGTQRMLAKPPEPEVILSFYTLWRQSTVEDHARYAIWALGAQQLLPRDTFSKDVWGDCDLFLREAITGYSGEMTRVKKGALVVNWYRRGPYDDGELLGHIEKLIEDDPLTSDITIRELLQNLGDAGQLVIKRWERKQQEYRPRTVEQISGSESDGG